MYIPDPITVAGVCLMKKLRILFVVIAVALVTGCSGIVHQMPEANELEEARAFAEINAFALPLQKGA